MQRFAANLIIHRTDFIFYFLNTEIVIWCQKMYEEASKVANDAVGSVRTVASFCAEEKVMELYKKKCEGPIKAGIRQGLVSGVGFGLSLFFLFIVYACSFYSGAQLVADGKTTFSDVFRVTLTFALSLISPFGFSN